MRDDVNGSSFGVGNSLELDDARLKVKKKIDSSDVEKIFSPRYDSSENSDLEVGEVDFPSIKEFLERGSWDAYDTALYEASDSTDLYGLLSEIGGRRGIVEFYGGLPHQNFPEKIEAMIKDDRRSMELTGLVTMGGNSWENSAGLHYPAKDLTGRAEVITEFIPKMVRQNNAKVIYAGLDSLDEQPRHYRDALKYISSSKAFKDYTDGNGYLEDIPRFVAEYHGPLESWEEEIYDNSVNYGIEDESVRIIYTVQDLFHSFEDISTPKNFLETSEGYYGDLLNTIIVTNSNYDEILESWTVKTRASRD